jgi:uncharacterized protein with FMN-binding domain
MNRTTKRSLLIPMAAATTLAVSTLAACGGQTATTGAAATSTAVTSTVATSSAATSSSAASSGGALKDGTYAGSSVQIRWGDVQVQAVIQNGKITDVKFLSYPTDARSQQINSQAAPALAQEAVQAQSASVQVVSGATFTSRAFMQSLAAAISQAS